MNCIIRLFKPSIIKENKELKQKVADLEEQLKEKQLQINKVNAYWKAKIRSKK